MLDLFDPLAIPPSALVALDLMARSTALMALALLAHALLGRRRAPARSAVWNACLVGLLLLPAASLASPRLRLAVLPADLPPPAAAIPPAPLAPPAYTPEPFAPPAAQPAHTYIPTHVDPISPAQPPAPRPFSWPGPWSLAAAFYLAVAGLLAFRLALAIAAIGRLRRGSSPVDSPAWTAPLDRWRDRLCIPRPVPLLATDRVPVPVAIGWLRPAILVPRPLAESASPTLIDAVLLHELAHIRRADYAWNLLHRAVSIAYWPHPLAWLAGRLMATAREQACDSLCVHALGGPAPYRASLIAVAESASSRPRRPGPALGMAMAHPRPSLLSRRLSWIDFSPGSPLCLPPAPSRLSILLTTALLSTLLGSLDLARASARQEAPAPAIAETDNRFSPSYFSLGEFFITPAPPDAMPPRLAAADGGPGLGFTIHSFSLPSQDDSPAPPPAPGPSSIEILVRSADTGLPLPGAKVRYSFDHAHPRQADPNGLARIDLDPAARGHASFDIWADGHVQQSHNFDPLGRRSPTIPDRLEVDLFPADETLGGTVTDEAGRPIAGATVSVWAHLGAKRHEREDARLIEATTDAQGRWRARNFRQTKSAVLYLSHPAYLSYHAYGSPRQHGPSHALNLPPLPDGPTPAPFLDFSDLQVMTRGVEVSGVVVDQAGRPVPGALVDWVAPGESTPGGVFPTAVATDAQGRFRFPHAQPGELILGAWAAGHAPERAKVDATKPLGPVSITLGPPQTVSGRVVDPQGNPIAGASIYVGPWPLSASVRTSLQTDPDGRFRWDEAPADPATISVIHPGYLSLGSQRLAPGEEPTYTLHSVFSISGLIREKGTATPIKTARVEVGTPDPQSGEIRWADSPQSHSGDHYGVTVLPPQASEVRLRFVAHGYKPIESPPFRPGKRTIRHDVDLEPDPEAPFLTGVVHRPDGQPLPGAEVAIAYPPTQTRGWPLRSVWVSDGRFHPGPKTKTVTTDARGRFRIAREPGLAAQHFTVVVVHPDYFAEAPRPAFEAGPAIVARPWGRIEGITRRGNLPAAGAEIHFSSERPADADRPSFGTEGSAKADAQGRFVLEHVIPGEVRITWGQYESDTPVPYYQTGALVSVEPGQTARAELGGQGRPVVAAIEFPAGLAPADSHSSETEYSIESHRPRVPYPDDVRRAGTTAEWAARWWSSADGLAYRRSYRRVAGRLAPDGTLRADDLPPGDYLLALTHTAEPYQGSVIAPRQAAYATRRFTIPEIAGGRADDPLDLGPIRLAPRAVRQVGQPAPPFDVETLDGGRARLSDFRGQFLVLHFWSTYEAASLADLNDLKSLRARFGADARLALLGLCLDLDKDEALSFLADQGLDWPQGHINRTLPLGVLGAYEVDQPPALFLIGPDGKLLASSTTPHELEAALSAALGQH